MSLEGLKTAIERIILDPRFHDVFSLLKTARNGAVYGTKIRFPHALVFREKCSLVLRATRKHATNLAKFASIYKTVMLLLKHFGPTPGKEGPYDPFFAGLLGGYLVFGQRSKKGNISSISQQIVIYIFARVVLALARLAITPGVGLPALSADPALRARIAHYAWPAFASLSWGMVMLLFRHHPDDLQSSLRSSMVYIYRDCDSWDSLRTLLWHNK
ncbi:Peroxisomal membrane protein 4 [Escovopsis weberi]|uniref:Peroxisomal membrane protein 4 n=1 Tax=Escovopsis weberi TaxID=150374 RepID=A0A0M9VRU3_ESCWE|nr:Peroxisomal membrane protein 4 [Escovopsis weberi]